jgi:glycosyltransferase involved in cell wall biosynthesis
MRILQVIPTLSRGGAESVVVDLSNELNQIGHYVHVLLAYPVPSAESRTHSLQSGVNVQYLRSNPPSRFNSYIDLVRYIVRNRSLIKGFDIVHCHLSMGQFFGFVWRIINLLYSRQEPKLIYTCHNVGGNNPRWQRQLDQLSTRVFNDFVLMAQNKIWKSFVSGRKKRNIFLIENGISMSIETKEDQFQDWSTRTLAVGTISRLQVERSPWRFLEVFASLKNQSDRDFSFLMGGEGPMRKSLEVQVEVLNLENQIVLPGIVFSPKQFLDSLDIYVTLNVGAITGIAGLEAVFSGTPVVALQSLADYEATSDDWMWSSSDPAEVASKINEISRNPVKAKELIQNQQLVVKERFRSEVMARKYLRIYTTKCHLSENSEKFEIIQIQPL